MTYSCTSNGVMSKTVLNLSNIWSFHALGPMLSEKYIQRKQNTTLFMCLLEVC